VIRGLIFDLDGTLVDSLPGITGSLNRALQAHGLPTHSPAAVRGFIGNGSRMLITRAALPHTETALLDAIEQSFKEDYDRTWAEGTIPYPGIDEMLKELQAAGHRLAVLSNKPHPFTAAIVAHLFADISFDHVQGQESGIPHKPDPLGALLTIQKMGLNVTDCTFIGDSTIDLETAHRAGMHSIAVTWGYHDLEHLVAGKPGAIAATPAQVTASL